jgi:hypothetical protein
MIEYFKYRAKLIKLFCQKETVRSAFAEDIRKAQKEHRTKDVESLEYESFFEESLLDEEISILATDNLIRKARRHFVPIPTNEVDGMWEQCSKISTRYVLTNKGISELRSSLRKERKEKVELVVIILATLTGVVGAVTGLVAVIMK